MISPAPRLALALALACLLAGCAARPVQQVAQTPSPANWFRVLTNSPGGDIAIDSLSEAGVTMKGGFEHGLYSLGHDTNTATILLYAGDLDNPTQAVTIRMFWAPRAGSTPIDATATNATIHYVIFSPPGSAPGSGAHGGVVQEVGIYSGAGFLFPQNDPGASSLSAGVWQANLRLSDHTSAFKDLLGEANVKGNFTAKRDDIETDRALRRLSALLRARLGYPRLVHENADLPLDSVAASAHPLPLGP